MKKYELKAAHQSGALDLVDSDSLCRTLDRVIFYLEEVQKDVSGWKFWITLGFTAAIGALKALRAYKCGPTTSGGA